MKMFNKEEPKPMYVKIILKSGYEIDGMYESFNYTFDRETGRFSRLKWTRHPRSTTMLSAICPDDVSAIIQMDLK